MEASSAFNSSSFDEESLGPSGLRPSSHLGAPASKTEIEREKS